MWLRSEDAGLNTGFASGIRRGTMSGECKRDNCPFEKRGYAMSKQNIKAVMDELTAKTPLHERLWTAFRRIPRNSAPYSFPIRQ